MAERIASLEGLRGVAASLVLLFHFQDLVVRHGGAPPLRGVFGAGDRGVDLFFVLSGFIILWTHERDIGRPAEVGRYVFKRACRLFPGVWITTALAAAVYSLRFGGAEKAFKLEFWHVVSSFWLLPQAQPALVNVTWTLTYEVFFYGLFAVLVANRTLGILLLLAWQGALVLAAVGLVQPADWLAGHYLRPICLEFGIGMLCAVLARRVRLARRAGPRVGVALLVLGCGVFFGAALVEGVADRFVQEAGRPLVYGLGAGAIILGCSVLERHWRVRIPRPVQWLGTVSYSVYLTNFSVMTLAWLGLDRLRAAGADTLALPVCIGLALLCGSLFHVLVDAPIQRALRRAGQSWLGQRDRMPATAGRAATSGGP